MHPARRPDEAMLLKHMLEIAKSDDEKLLYLGSALENLRGTFFRQAMFADFEREVHARVDRGEALGGADFTKIYGAILRRYHGGAEGVVKIDDVDDLVRQAGVDLPQPAPYRSIVARMNRIMDEIEAIEARASGKH